VEPEFQKALIVVLVVGSVIFGIGTFALVLVFRGFGKRPGSSEHFALIAALLGFVFAVCVALLILSYR